MDGFKRPKKPPVDKPVLRDSQERQLPRPRVESMSQQPTRSYDAVSVETPVEQQATARPEATDTSRSPDVVVSRRRPYKRYIAFVIAGLLAALGIGAWMWFEQSLAPVDASSQELNRFEVKDGSTFGDIASQLEQRGLIRSTQAFDIYARLQGKRGSLKASTCSLRASMSAQEILDKLSNGCHDFISVMFYPGATIEKPLYKPEDATIDQEKMYIKYVLKSAGFSDSEVEAALKKQYDSPLFADKPAGTTLEGYIFGETYYVDKSSSAEDVLRETFAHMYSIVQKEDLVSKFKAHDLNLYQGITLASIVQRELNCEGKPTAERKERCYSYQRTIAQIFLKRLKENISLGSDVTFIYAADMMKVSPSVDIDSPYNTRKYPGLPPGPIASPGELALKAVANPTDTDYLYFIAGDDGLIYFAKDEAGHQRNIREHCQVMCGNAV